jgi:hypothetical protein
MEKLWKLIKHLWTTGDLGSRLAMVCIALFLALPPYTFAGIGMDLVCSFALYGTCIFGDRLWLYKGIWKKL